MAARVAENSTKDPTLKEDKYNEVRTDLERPDNPNRCCRGSANQELRKKGLLCGIRSAASRVGKESEGEVERLNNRAIIKSLHAKGMKPTIDRKDSDGHYSLDNIRITDWGTNSREGGKLGGDKTAAATSRPIKGVSLLDVSDVVYFASSYDAARNGFHQANVTSCLTGKRQSAGGYRWSYQMNK